MKKHIFTIILLLFAMAGAVEARQERSGATKDAFKREHPCPSTLENRGPCPGYVIDHVKPLDCGGADDPGNMQWQTEAEGKAKDKWERNGCHVGNGQAIKANITSGDCGGKNTCGDMKDCAEARHYLKDCGVDRLDKDHDGVPCESLCKGNAR